MELEYAREFMILARSMNFTAAAQELHLSQPALSKHVKTLEAELGVTLISRGGPNEANRLTEAGLLFVERVKDLLADFDSLAQECRQVTLRLPPLRIQGAQHGFNVVSQLRDELRKTGTDPLDFRYVKTDLPIIDALDSGVLDLAIHLEAVPSMVLFANPELRDMYGWLPLKPEPLFLLAGEDNPLYGREEISAAEVSSTPIIFSTSPAYESWPSAVRGAFLAHGCLVNLRGVPDAPLEGGAFPLGAQSLGVCTERFAHYYRDLDAETFCVLKVSEFTPVFYPFLVYRRDNASPALERLVNALSD